MIQAVLKRRSFLAIAFAAAALIATAQNSLAEDVRKITGLSANPRPTRMPDLLLASFSRPKWHDGQLMAFSGIDGHTDYEQGLTLRTTTQPAGLEIVGSAFGSIVFDHPPNGDVVFSNDFFSFPTAQGPVTGCLVDAHHLLISGPARVSGGDGSIRSVSKGGFVLVGAADKFNPLLIDTDLDTCLIARSRWLLDQKPFLDQVSGPTRNTLTRAFSIMKGQVYSPEGTIRHRWTTPDRWPHRDMWMWDSIFHAIGWRHVDPALARDILDAVFDKQQANGMIPHQMWPEGASMVTQPPLLAYGMKLVDETEPDTQWIKRNYPKLKAYLGWDKANRDQDGDGLVGWAIQNDPICRSRESGMDNSPRFDGLNQMDAVDFNAYLALECETMAGFADRLGYQEDALRWRAQHAKICGLINTRLWSDKEQFYCDYDTQRQKLSPVLSSAGFLPLICGAATPQQAEALARHLRDPNMFGTAFPVPSIPVRDRKNYSEDMWRGPSWVNINWLIARGLERYEGLQDMAKSLDAMTTREVERKCEAYGTLFECFDSRSRIDPPFMPRKGRWDPKSDIHTVVKEYGWSATLYLDRVFTAKNLKSQAPPKSAPLLARL
jgi:putative isomerase